MCGWTEQLSIWMQKKETISFFDSELEKEIQQTALETDSLLEASSKLESVYSQLLGKFDHVNH